MFESDSERRSPSARNPRVGVLNRLWRAVRRMLGRAVTSEITFIPPFTDDPPDDDDMAGSGVPRRPPNQSGSGAVALAEPRSDEAGPDEQTAPYARPSR